MNASNSDLEHYSVLLTVDGDKLDYELQQIWSLIIDVSDGLNPSDSYSFLIQVEDEPDNRPEWQSVPSVKDITEGISEVRVIKYQKYEFDIPLHSLTLRKGTSFYYGWVVGPENGNVPLLYVVKMSLCTLTCKIIVWDNLIM